MINRVLLLATFGLCTLLGTGCSGAGDPPPPMAAPADTVAMAAPDAPVVCANHEAGCPCDTPHDLIDCGRVKRVAGDYVWCSTGMQECTDGKWGACTGDEAVAVPAQ
ncbi:MAG: hypothetical protein ABI488_17560 [Polyangiaceae bacterium]